MIYELFSTMSLQFLKTNMLLLISSVIVCDSKVHLMMQHKAGKHIRIFMKKLNNNKKSEKVKKPKNI